MERKNVQAATPALPVEIVSKADLVHVRRELENLQELLAQTKLRGLGQQKQPEVSNLTERFAAAAKLDLVQPSDVNMLVTSANELLKSAPIIHISFASTPNRAFMEKIVRWFRSEIKANILLQVGLQPSIAAGCIVRTPSKQFDLSLRQFLIAKQGLLADMIGERQ